MKRAEAFPSDFLRAEDLEGKNAPVLSIADVTSETMTDGEQRRCLTFKETAKKLILNKTNWTTIAELTGKDDDSDWIGYKVCLVLKTVLFKGDAVKAIRVEAPANVL